MTTLSLSTAEVQWLE